MTVVDDFLNNLTALGFFEFLLPWLFTFAVVYGLLMKASLFGSDVNKKVSGVVALVLAFFIAPAAGPQLTAFFTSLGTGITVVLAGIVTFVLFAVILGVEGKFRDKGPTLWFAIGAAVVVFLMSTGGTLGILPRTLGGNTLMSILFVLVLLAVVWFVVKGDGGSAPAPAPAPANGH
jgi:hypothetical protein